MGTIRLIARLRWPLLAVIWLADLPRHWDAREGDWHYFTTAVRLLGGHGPGRGLHLFAAHPELTMGPGSLAVTWLLELGGTNGLARAEFLMWLLGPVTLLLLERAALRAHDVGNRLYVQMTVLLGGAMLLPTWAHAAGGMAHLDDVLAMTFAALAVWAVAAGRPWVLVLAIALAADASLWGVVLLPLCLAPQIARPFRTATASVVAMALPWLPFILADHATISGSSYTESVDPKSAFAALGLHATQMPHWVRPAQVLLGIALAAVLVRRVHWGTAIAAALAVRLALDPEVFGYYTPMFVLAALVLDLVALRRPLPVATLTTYLAIEVVPAWVTDQSLLARVRLLDAVALIAFGALARASAFSSGRWGRPNPCTTR